MSLQQPREPWSRLTASARELRDDRDTAAPFGFATRVAALALAQERRISSAFDRFALRALGVASLLAIASVALNYNAISLPAVPTSAVASADEMEPVLLTDDAVALVLDVAD